MTEQPKILARASDLATATAEIDRLRKDQEEWSKLAASQEEQIDYLLQQRDRLLAACGTAMSHAEANGNWKLFSVIRAAIATVEDQHGEQIGGGAGG